MHSAVHTVICGNPLSLGSEAQNAAREYLDAKRELFSVLDVPANAFDPQYVYGPATLFRLAAQKIRSLENAVKGMRKSEAAGL